MDIHPTKFTAAEGARYRTVTGGETVAAVVDLPMWKQATETLVSPTGYSANFPVWKRMLDMTLVVITAPLWLPLMIMIMFLIKIVSPGPTFFRQERIGFKGRRFMCLKFRSMKVNAETRSHEGHLEKLMQSNSPMTKLDAIDPRVIPFGRVLRATGLDELPQIFNVIQGDMSLVGPRPCTPHEFRHYQEWQQERVNAPPGITGYWQVNGKNKTTFSEMISMDIHYAKTMSAWLDILILIKTFPAILMQVLEARLNAAAGLRENGSASFMDSQPQVSMLSKTMEKI